jgi:peptide deformylase
MAEFTIRTYGDPLLRAPGEPVREFGPPLRTLGEAMLSAMRKARGIGLAAPQVGLSLQLFVLNICDEESPLLLDGKIVEAAKVMPMLLANANVTGEISGRAAALESAATLKRAGSAKALSRPIRISARRFK